MKFLNISQTIVPIVPIQSLKRQQGKNHQFLPAFAELIVIFLERIKKLWLKVGTAVRKEFTQCSKPWNACHDHG